MANDPPDPGPELAPVYPLTPKPTEPPPEPVIVVGGPPLDALLELLTRAKFAPNRFDKALKTVRLARGLSQEAFDLVSSRTYVSTLERGLKSPTISKIEELATVLGVHPLTLLALSYLDTSTYATFDGLARQVSAEIDELRKGEIV